MEELRSTEALDREILEDARKKAFKILKSADESAAGSKTNWDSKLTAALDKARQTYRGKAEQFRAEIMARLPMDKRRIRSEKINTILAAAMDDFLASLSRPDLLRIMEKELAGRAAALSTLTGAAAAGDLRCGGLSKAELAELLKKVSVTFQNVSMVEEPFPSMVINAPECKITVSAAGAAQELLLDRRAELAGALLKDAAHE